MPGDAAGARGIVVGVVAHARLVGHELLPTDVRRVHLLVDRRPLLQRTIDHAALARAPLRVGPMAPVDESASVGRVAQRVVDRGVGGPAPDDLTGVQPTPLAPGQEDGVVTQAAQHPLAAAQPREMGEDQIERVLHLEVRIFDNPPIGPPDQPGGEPLAVGAALHRAEAPLPHPLLQHVQLGLTQDTPQAQQQAVVVLARVVHAIGVGDERADAAGQVQQRVPVDVVACQPAGLVGQDDADVA